MVKPVPRPIADESEFLRTPENWQPTTEPPFMRGLAPIVVSSGTVCAIGRVRAVTLVRHRRAFVWVQWYQNVLPPKVKRGSRIGFIGHLQTFNLGHKFQVTDAVLLKSSPKSILRALLRSVPDLVVDPAGYLNDGYAVKRLAMPEPTVPQPISQLRQG